MAELVGQRDVLGRVAGPDGGPVADIGRFLAPDRSLGGAVGLDIDSPHVVSIVGKRGSGKSYTLGVLAEAITATAGLTGVVVDTMGVFGGLSEVGATVLDSPTIQPTSVPARDWPAVVGLDANTPAGSLLWRAAADEPTLRGMRTSVSESSADAATKRVVDNHLRTVESWGCFDADGFSDASMFDADLTVLDCSRLPEAARVALVGAVARVLYRHAVTHDRSRLPWLLVDEAHACYTDPAREAFDTLLTRGRQPGVSVALATQRPGALSPVVVSQTDLLVAHRLTTASDIDALVDAQPTTVATGFVDRLPDRPGDALVVDDATDDVATIRVRERRTPHGGGSPRASRRSRNC